MLTYGQQRMWEVVQSLDEEGFTPKTPGEWRKLYHQRFDDILSLFNTEHILSGLVQKGYMSYYNYTSTPTYARKEDRNVNPE